MSVTDSLTEESETVAVTSFSLFNYNMGVMVSAFAAIA